MSLKEKTKLILCKTNVAAGTTDITDSTVIDMQGYGGCRFIFAFGVLTAGAVTSVGVAGKDTNTPTEGVDDLAGSKGDVADDDDNKIIAVDIKNPLQRYLRPFVKRATQNAVLNSIVAELYDPIKMPTVADASLIGEEFHLSPAVGTA